MGNAVVNSAMLRCSFGQAPGTLMVLPVNRVQIGAMPMANIMDNKPLINILPFGLCSSLANPTVASATSAAMGVLTPMPCVPVTAAPWAPGSPTVLVGNMPALTQNCKLMCSWGGVIEVANPGQMEVQVP
ncbi:DUF4280 domain-containing protein [Heliobacillus mobilis]|uniref:DUF4280 domain-containing protein n=1 Tax=Heliobacterium mobile TaxID=28064 RepID=A0A6I3SQA4_HELMO|nr:DUF4280 domain-containing protein [Heliobacterium mobile]MTV50367.1 DUF4280 domain-containing protein [Heliobacterium mobile]